ncbi:hypothetical protein KUV26_22630 [Leisingera daeponensis]|uniref:Uncharacterized protein n=1 Tax=Leisingera daeponensis TaxID=405746 RepID=A0ABS7NM05_9RHOB|nr:hypothetical protein [Leisingera daeponensis]MBY6142234.1 hypothetical protein [Leisingera daeponensis]
MPHIVKAGGSKTNNIRLGNEKEYTMAGGVITMGIIGASVASVTSAASIASQTLSQTRGNLAQGLEIVNGTNYPLRPIAYGNRLGAAIGREGVILKAPDTLAPREIDVVVTDQNGLNDNIGAVIYRSEIFDLLVGWHVYDAVGDIFRFCTAQIFPTGNKTPNGIKDEYIHALNGSTWNADLEEWLNKRIWSGGGYNSTNHYTSNKIGPAYAMPLKGKFSRGIVSYTSEDKELKKDPTIDVKSMYGTGQGAAFSSLSKAGAKTAMIYVSDTPLLLEEASNSYDCDIATSILDAEMEKKIAKEEYKDQDAVEI